MPPDVTNKNPISETSPVLETPSEPISEPVIPTPVSGGTDMSLGPTEAPASPEEVVTVKDYNSVPPSLEAMAGQGNEPLNQPKITWS